MRNRTVISLALLTGCALAAAGGAARACDDMPAVVAEPKPAPRPVDLAICLDTSGSMDGLLDAARQRLWAIVNELALAKPSPRLRVALLTYGNNGHSADSGYIAVDSGFTDDLDLVSQKLFALTTNGGEEYVGHVLRTAVDTLDWTKSKDALQIVVVAGNEGADQGSVPFRDACARAIGRGIMVNSIYCGPAGDGVAPGWREVAKLADGQFAAIDHNHGTVVLASPFDDQLAALSASVNTTYLPFGATGGEGAARQEAQDANATNSAPAAAAGRAATKANGMYRCAWDLVDACKEKDFDLAKVEVTELPEAMRKMTPEERRKHVEAKAKERAEIQAKILELDTRRQAWVAEEMKKQSLSDDQSFDANLRRALREQAAKKGFEFAGK